jgi:hypothetical protein
MKITFESVAFYPCMVSYRIKANCGNTVSVRRDVLLTIAPHHTFFLFSTSTSSHNTSSRRPGITLMTSIVQNERA